ncbi:MAG TPA: hypothetical protein VKY92_14295, partial [Verrucomicrobiae bacterium]|nr:hypothetical protein [Verrucomicrobiae bacterium]
MKPPLRLFLTILFSSALPVSELSAATPPAGFIALFNGQDLSGWWGAETEDPRKYLALDPVAFKEKHDASLKDIRQHWRAVNDELINDGQGL